MIPHAWLSASGWLSDSQSVAAHVDVGCWCHNSLIEATSAAALQSIPAPREKRESAKKGLIYSALNRAGIIEAGRASQRAETLQLACLVSIEFLPPDCFKYMYAVNTSSVLNQPG